MHKPQGTDYGPQKVHWFIHCAANWICTHTCKKMNSVGIQNGQNGFVYKGALAHIEDIHKHIAVNESLASSHSKDVDQSSKLKDIIFSLKRELLSHADSMNANRYAEIWHQINLAEYELGIIPPVVH